MIPELLISILLNGLFFWRQGNVGLNTADEGYLAHGVTRIHAGQVPVRDFKSYDPFRYYWCYFAEFILGRGIIRLRAAATVFLTIGLWIVLVVAHEASGKLWSLVPLAVILLYWVPQLFKAFEPATSMISVAVAAAVVTLPNQNALFLSGLWCMIVFVIGFNHGIYAVAGILSLICVIAIHSAGIDVLSSLGYWGAGFGVGCAIILLLSLFIRGIIPAYAVRIKRIFSFTLGKTAMGKNRISLPVPMPWRATDPKVHILHRIAARMLGAHYLCVPLYFLVALAFMVITGVQNHPLFSAATFIGAPYLHHAFSRADFDHLSESIAPFILSVAGLVFFIAGGDDLIIGLFMMAMVSITFFTVGLRSPIFGPIMNLGRYQKFRIGNEFILIPHSLEKRLSAIRTFMAPRLRDNSRLFVAPFEPTLYEIFGLISPVKNDCLFTVTNQFDQQDIVDQLTLSKVDAVFVNNFALDNAETRRFSIRCPIIWSYLTTEFEKIDMPMVCGAYAFYFRR